MLSIGCSDQDGFNSPQALFQAEHNALLAKDRLLFMRTVPPEYKDAMRGVFHLAMRCSEQIDAIALQIKLKYGKRASEAFIDKYCILIWRSQFSEVAANGVIDWSLLEIEIVDDVAKVRLPDNGGAFAKKLPNGKWYRIYADSDNIGESLNYISMSEGYLRDFLKELDDIAMHVASGDYPASQSGP
ncbi:MAG: hypothetical protein HZA50_06840 [Planctomycetes bacterium]|nr:hypothetical protein [Planctomycetota bacterium]